MKSIPLTKGYITIVDDEDYERLSVYKWHALDVHPRLVYAARWIGWTKPRRVMRMHHEIMGVDPTILRRNNLVTDHIDRDGLNNQKTNLRIATRAENIINSSHCDNALGIYLDKTRNRYKAYTLLPVKIYIGTYLTLEEALKAKREYENN